MKNLFTLFIISLCTGYLSAQVPAQEDGVAPIAPIPANAQNTNSLPSGLFSDPSEIAMIAGLDEPLERVKLRDQDTNMILDMIQAITGRYILRPQNLPQVKINFDSMNILTKRETLLALESLLAMNGIGITKIDSQFFKAVPATGMNTHVPIWLDVPPSSLPPSQRIYVKLFSLDYISAEKMRDILNPFATPNVSSLIIDEVRNTILITDALLNLQRMEKIMVKIDKPKEDSPKIIFWYKTSRFSAEALATMFESQWELVWKREFYTKPVLITESVAQTQTESQKSQEADARSSVGRMSGGSKDRSSIDRDANGTKSKTQKAGGSKGGVVTISTSKGMTGDLPEKQLGIICHQNDKKKLIEILDALDLQPDLTSDFVTFWFNPNRFSAKELEDLFTDQWDTIWKSEFYMLPVFMPTSFGDQLGIVCHQNDKEKLKEILQSYDVDIRAKVSSMLVPLYHASADDVFGTVSTLLENLQSGGTNLSPDSNSSEKDESFYSGKADVSNMEALGNVTFTEMAMVVTDTRSNGLFVFGTQQDVVKLESLIKQLDVPLPMARIDTIFVMVDLSQANQRGIDALFQDLNWNDNEITSSETVSIDTDGDNIPDTDQTTTSTTGAQTLTGGLKVPFLNSGLEFQMENWKIQQIKWNQIFSLASSREDVRIFSTPSITVSHGGNEGNKGDSYIEIKDERKVGLPGAVTSNGNYGSSDLKTLEARTRLDILNPRIRKTIRDENGSIVEAGTVFMSVVVEASKFDTTTANTYEGQTLPTTKSRKASTDIAIRDGQIMVLGGFREVQLDEEVSRYNFLSDIPYIGEKIFTPTQRRYTPTELMIFIRPRIIDPENPLDDRSHFNSSRIDAMMRKKYTPVFRSPSGKVFGGPEKTSQTSSQDTPASRPPL